MLLRAKTPHVVALFYDLIQNSFTNILLFLKIICQSHIFLFPYLFAIKPVSDPFPIKLSIDMLFF